MKDTLTAIAVIAGIALSFLVWLVCFLAVPTLCIVGIIWLLHHM